MFGLTGDLSTDENELSIYDYKETAKLINSAEFKQRKLFPAAASEMISLYNQDPFVQLDPRKCCMKLSNLSPHEILYNFAYLDFWQSINYKSQYALDYFNLTNNKYEHSYTQFNSIIKNESHQNKIQPCQIENPIFDHSKTCVSCGRNCRYLMYILIPPLTNGNISAISNNYDLSDCIWCPRCYSSGRIPPPLTRNHFSKIQIPFEFADKNSLPWTQYELQLLIEAIDTYNDDWESIARSVGKTPQECLLKFSQLPIEELIIKGSSLDKNSDPVVFGKTPNEFLAYLAFISNSVSPVISSGGAKAALEILLSDSKIDQLSSTGNSANEPMFRHETFKIAYDTARQCTQKNAEILADLEHEKIKQLLKDIYDLQLQITAVQTEKFEVLNEKIHECTTSMANYLVTKS